MQDDDGLIKEVPRSQFAYKKQHSALHAADMVLEEAEDAGRKNKSLGILATDVKYMTRYGQQESSSRQ